MRMLLSLGLVLMGQMVSMPSSMTEFIPVSPTRTTYSLLRGGPGAFNARRGDALHSGIDIVANQSSMDKEIYKVVSIRAGKVAYTKINGSNSEGYGYTIVIDHGDDFYSLYAHLAVKASAGLVRIGDTVSQGQTIGYLADLANNEKSSGNVRSDVVLAFDKIQLHFEVFRAPSGRESTSSLAVLKQGSTLENPTQRLTALGYKSF